MGGFLLELLLAVSGPLAARLPRTAGTAAVLGAAVLEVAVLEGEVLDVALGAAVLGDAVLEVVVLDVADALGTAACAGFAACAVAASRRSLGLGSLVVL